MVKIKKNYLFFGKDKKNYLCVTHNKKNNCLYLITNILIAEPLVLQYLMMNFTVDLFIIYDHPGYIKLKYHSLNIQNLPLCTLEAT